MSGPAASDHGVLRFFTDAWPVLALGVIGALIVRACVPAHQDPSMAQAPAWIDASTADRTGGPRATAALSALTPGADVGPVMEALNLVSIDFGAGSSVLPDSAEPMLKRVAEVMSARPEAERFEVSARGDGNLSPLADLELSRRRSQALVEFLVNQGVSATRLQARAIGDPAPVTNEPGQDSGPRNPRVQFTLLP